MLQEKIIELDLFDEQMIHEVTVPSNPLKTVLPVPQSDPPLSEKARRAHGF